MGDKKQDKLKGQLDLDQKAQKTQEDDADSSIDEASQSSRGVLDQLSQPGGLEVEDMPESNELQERRRKTKNRLQELASVKEPGEEGIEPFEEESGLFDLLREAHLSTRHLKFCCAGVLVFILLAAFYFGGQALWDLWQNRVLEEPEEELIEEPEEESGFLDPTIFSGILVGEDVPEPDAALDAGQDLGEPEEENTDSLTESIVDFSTLYETMQVNVNELLAQSNERRETLEDYQNELHYLLYLGEQNVEKLEDESSNLVLQFEAVEGEKALSEERYFNELKDLDAYAAASALEVFSEQAQEVVALRAQYNARQKLLSYYEELLLNLERRIVDIELNEEALVKGVQVVDIEGSDLDLIIDEAEL